MHVHHVSVQVGVDPDISSLVEHTLDFFFSPDSLVKLGPQAHNPSQASLLRKIVLSFAPCLTSTLWSSTLICTPSTPAMMNYEDCRLGRFVYSSICLSRAVISPLIGSHVFTDNVPVATHSVNTQNKSDWLMQVTSHDVTVCSLDNTLHKHARTNQIG